MEASHLGTSKEYSQLQFMQDLQSIYFSVIPKYSSYCNDPNFLDRQVEANSADPDQTASGLARLSVLKECYTIRELCLM